MTGRFDFLIRSQKDMVDAVKEFGFVPLFRNSVAGFSIEEHCDERCWFADGEGVWEWKGPVIRRSGCAYGKFFEKKAAFVSCEWFAQLANYRRDGYDFDARFEDGLASYKDRDLYELVAGNAPIISRELKRLGDYRKGARGGFDVSMGRLQEQGYVVISDFVYSRDRYGRRCGWGLAEYSTPEKALGGAFCAGVYAQSPRESYERIFEHLCGLFPDTDRETLRSFLK